MNYGDLITKVQINSGLSKAQAQNAVYAVIDAIVETLIGGEEARLTGFGTFTLSKSPARQGRNPRTGEVISVSARTTVKFRAGAKLKEAVTLAR